MLTPLGIEAFDLSALAAEYREIPDMEILLLGAIVFMSVIKATTLAAVIAYSLVT